MAEVLPFLYRFLRDAVFAIFLILVVRVAVREGVAGLLRRGIGVLKLLPGAEALLLLVLRREVRGFLKQIDQKRATRDVGGTKTVVIPEKGLSQEELLEELKQKKKVEVDPHTGKIFAYVYTSEDQRFHCLEKVFDMFEFDKEQGESIAENAVKGRAEINPEILARKDAVVRMFYHAFMHENALNPMVFPSLRQFETEVVAMVGNMLHGGSGVVGTLTSGGTESILMAVKTYRDRARHLFPSIKEPEIVAPITIHPAFEKAAGYFDVKIVHVALGTDYRVDVDAYKKAVTPNTILLLASAPEYCYGMVDPLEQISELAVTRGLPLHVDACFGGFMLPWVEKLGYNVPVFDFRLPGVTSMSADVHKYGLGIKGSSVLVYKTADIRRYQIFTYAEWPGGLYGSPSMAGTRPGGNIASSWAVLKVMGEEGYMEVARRLMEVTQYMKEGIAAIEGLCICGSPHMTAFTIASTDPRVDIFAVADVMETNGWKIERQLETLHCSILPSHTIESARQLVADLQAAVTAIKSDPSLAKKGSAGVYGMVAMIPDKAIVKDFVVEFFNEVYSL